MKKLLIVVVITLLSKSSLTNAQAPDNTLLDIEFQDYFANDRVDLKINDVLIFKDIIINSEKSTGFTDKVIKINKLGKNLVQIHYLASTIIVKLTDQIKVEIFLNGVENIFVVDGNKGKYVGFSKKDGNQLYFVQRVKPFVYD